MKALLIGTLGLFCLGLSAMVALQIAGSIGEGLTNKRFVVHGGRILRRDGQPAQYWFHVALFAVIGGLAVMFGAMSAWMIASAFSGA